MFVHAKARTVTDAQLRNLSLPGASKLVVSVGFKGGSRNSSSIQLTYGPYAFVAADISSENRTGK